MSEKPSSLSNALCPANYQTNNQTNSHATTFYLWRHPKPINATGRCIGHTDLLVDKRKLRRLANHIHVFTRHHRLPKVIWLSSLQRSRGVGDILAKRGFVCHISTQLCEIDFGDWDGRPWAAIAKAEIDAWCANFADFTPNSGENVQQLYQRVRLWLTQQSESQTQPTSVLVVGHAGWITAACMVWANQGVPQQPSDWPAPPKYRQLKVLSPRPA